MTDRELWQKAAELIGVESLQKRFRRWILMVIKRGLTTEGTEGHGKDGRDGQAVHAQQIDGGGDKGAVECAPTVADAVIRDLNTVAGRGYRVTRQVVVMIRALMIEGYILEDFKRVHEVKAAQWLTDEKMAPYLRPSTLYRKSHFDEYLAEWDEFERKRQERASKGSRRSAQMESQIDTEKEDPKVKDRELMGREWWEFEKWEDFVRWTSQLSSAEALARYEMPDWIRKLREAEGSLMKVATGRVPAWVEKEYQKAKRERKAPG